MRVLAGCDALTCVARLPSASARGIAHGLTAAALPRSILANKEPFKGGDWRKTPYIPRQVFATGIRHHHWPCAPGSMLPYSLPALAQPAPGMHRCRPYVRLTEYDIVEPSTRELILRKLSTKVDQLLCCIAAQLPVGMHMHDCCLAPRMSWPMPRRYALRRNMVAAPGSTASHGTNLGSISERSARGSALADPPKAAHAVWPAFQKLPAGQCAVWSGKASTPIAHAFLGTPSAMSDAPAKTAVSKHSCLGGTTTVPLPRTSTSLTDPSRPPFASIAGSADSCLNRAVTNRQTLQLGIDAQEVDSWGMDCYVRRNIMDGAPWVRVRCWRMIRARCTLTQCCNWPR